MRKGKREVPKEIEKLAYGIWRGEGGEEEICELWKHDAVQKVIRSAAWPFLFGASYDFWNAKALEIMKKKIREWNPIGDRDFLRWLFKVLRREFARIYREYHPVKPPPKDPGKLMSMDDHAELYEKAKKELRKELGRKPKDEEIAERLGWKVEDVRIVEEYIFNMDNDLLINASIGVIRRSLDYVLEEESDERKKELYREIVYYDGSIPFRELAKKYGLTLRELRKLKREFLKKLKEKAETIQGLLDM